MKRMFNLLIKTVLLISITVICLWFYLNRGLPYKIEPANFNCYALEDGHFIGFDSLPNHIFGIGLTYAGHINETASYFKPNEDPPVFLKKSSSISKDGYKVHLPDHDALINAVGQLEPGIAEKINSLKNPLPALLDYEVELGFILLEDIESEKLNAEGFIPKLGFFVANDLSARSIVILGEGQENRYDYWGVGKSFPGFTPTSDSVWIPVAFKENAIPCIKLQCQVNGEMRQYQSTNDLIYTPLQLLQAIQRKYPDISLSKGDWVLTGTPGGVIMSTPRWKVRLAHILGLNRFQKLNFKTGTHEIQNYLKPGDVVVSRGEGLGSVSILISE